MLSPEQLSGARRAARLTQQQAAREIGVSQAYLALLESGRRPVTADLAARFVAAYGLGPSALPPAAGGKWTSARLAQALARLGYPGFRQLRGGTLHNPATVLLAAISEENLEVRVLEAAPWLIVAFRSIDWDWLIREAKLRDLQNRLGFLVALARKADDGVGTQLKEVHDALEHARLAREDTLCQASLSEAERQWLRRHRPVEARHWNLLTDLDAGRLPYAA
jgi:transcriptional regulator with XRE-family HTH domain